MPAQAQLTSLLSNQHLDRLSRMRLGASRRFTNRARGENLASKGGTSTEFCDFRDYAPGDDLRFIDWNIFARLERPYSKQFHLEEELHVAVLVDGSNSMLFENKYAVVRNLAAAFGVVALAGLEKLSVTVLGGPTPSRLAPCRGRASRAKLFGFLERVEPGGGLPLEQGVDLFLRRHTGRGVVIVLSDFLTTGNLARAFNSLNGAGLEIFAIQVLAPSELAPEHATDVRFVDSETDTTLDVSSAPELLALYHEYRMALTAQIEELCRKRDGRFLQVSAGDSIDTLLFDLLRRKGWIR